MARQGQPVDFAVLSQLRHLTVPKITAFFTWVRNPRGEEVHRTRDCAQHTVSPQEKFAERWKKMLLMPLLSQPRGSGGSQTR